MTRTIILVCFLASALFAADPVRYDTSFDNAIHHEAEVTVRWSCRSCTDRSTASRIHRGTPIRSNVTKTIRAPALWIP